MGSCCSNIYLLLLLLCTQVESKRTAIAAGIPVVPGPPGPVTDIATALDMAAQLGYPVIIKAKAGGGGKGIRPVHNDVRGLRKQGLLAS